MTKGVMNLPHRGDGWVQHTSIFDASKGCGPDAILRGGHPPHHELIFSAVAPHIPNTGQIFTQALLSPVRWGLAVFTLSRTCVGLSRLSGQL